MEKPLIQRLAPPGVTVLILFLALSSQYLFQHIEPGSLRKGDAYLFNTLVTALLVCYYRACYKDPGSVPNDWQETVRLNGSAADAAQLPLSQRWCRRCEIWKPPRAHHCKTCRRCILKMDHHCVWTANCVSHSILPHFVRFLFYAVVSMLYLERFLYTRCAVLWQKRHLPSYLGPNVWQLAHLFVLVVVNSLVLFALVLLLGRTIWSLTLNMTTIESWEVERHHALLRRARTLGGYLDGPDGTKVKIEQQEFPWDAGFWTNICQGMGSRNPLIWFWPFAQSPSIRSAFDYEHNCIDDPSKPWPPPDPDRMFRTARRPATGGDTLPMDINSFRARQEADMARYEDADGEYVVRRRPFHERLEALSKSDAGRVYEVEDDGDEDEDALVTDEDLPAEARLTRDGGDDAGEEGWRNKEGERLADFGVDEVADFYDEDDVPLAELLRRRRGGGVE
ncbi:hypothetical protein BAUCODRAFT_110937 [Baudoinia panamericana UAMH 10762]|uniref:Palmitoyltransferase PFA4 n=1 Tax=Baudoinia panamericana (strain UAMH 10762) TaxID=717646 RepID=M2MFK9_BAUPA|nr:uncharacterized protein BAUCODRAFT_110937 [Baudoinia panamericana UAMH 10762]EMC95436.1 hypothetical protein BAUCODRAFT_110937 [Baudoinia panamericana UAMH 10762]